MTKAAVAAQDKAMRALIGDIERIGSRAAAIVLPNVPETGKLLAAEVTSAVERYKSRYFAELDKAVGNADKDLKAAWKEEAKRGGWVYAGLYYQAMSAMAGQSQSLASRQPQVSAGPTLRGIPDPLAGYVKGAIEIADTAWRAGHTGAGAPNPSIMARAASGPIGQRGSDSDMAQTAGEAEAQIAGWIGGSVRSLLDHVGGKEASDPLARLISLGKSLTAVGTGIWLAPAVVAGIPVIGSMVGYLSGGITTVGFLMITAGIILGVVVPVMVACMWMYGVLGWLMSVIEAVVGASLWALAHLTLEGDGIEGSRGGNGYMLLLTITCRPILMLVGLMASLIMLRPAVEFATAGLASLMQSVAPDSLTGILFIVGFALAYAGFLLSVVYLVFGLVNQVPEQVMSWIGGHARGESMDAKSAYGAAAIATRASDAAQSIKYGRSEKDKDSGKQTTVGSIAQHIPDTTRGRSDGAGGGFGRLPFRKTKRTFNLLYCKLS
ncbi:DotA/TraY family protein [Azospirillum argentinense]|uniref:DotA/TraY family protein n=1 Tax=Azospirillum brasilense TaxID=192 RepID=A0A4D8QAQ6_AZOBR|nr:DotA/TraY family protein [Azospirillum argentinense]QCO07457.1 hypothetical protein D3867_36855 [Azospirillum argentinense]